MNKILIDGVMKAVVNIKGGFGNQIFQYAFSNYLKEIGYNVKVDTSVYNFLEEKITPRKLIISPKDFNLLIINDFEKIKFKFLKKLSDSKKLNFVFNFDRFNAYKKIVKLKEFNQSKKFKNSYFDGYWQDTNILENQKIFLIDSLSKNGKIKTSFEKVKTKGSTILMVRRGDYLSLKEDLSIEFYQNALIYCKENIKNFNYEIFTDDIEWVKNQNIFRDALEINPPSDEPDEVINLFSKMITFENFIIGNSTFSLVAAILGSNNDSRIVVADPWFKNKQGVEINNPKYIKIRNL